MSETHGPVVILLAAGRSSRFLASGGPCHKLEMPLCGLPVLEHVIRAVQACGLPWHVVRSAEGDGMGDSIAAGVRATPNASGWLVLPGDLPLITADSLRKVAQALAWAAIVVPTWHRQKGHPVGFAAQCFNDLLQLTGEHGAASIVAAQDACGNVLRLALDDQGIVQDVDTLDDLKYVETLMSQR
ncbi:nucleotidyltransferase family protein [Pseudomonas taetrolens]|uniref:nucleotidyltransferase family protein n=1 Tax=Pseudomonas taetrolens TaxID=47884 RepID=UPI003F96F201